LAFTAVVGLAAALADDKDKSKDRPRLNLPSNKNSSSNSSSNNSSSNSGPRSNRSSDSNSPRFNSSGGSSGNQGLGSRNLGSGGSGSLQDRIKSSQKNSSSGNSSGGGLGGNLGGNLPRRSSSDGNTGNAGRLNLGNQGQNNPGSSINLPRPGSNVGNQGNTKLDGAVQNLRDRLNRDGDSNRGNVGGNVGGNLPGNLGSGNRGNVGGNVGGNLPGNLGSGNRGNVGGNLGGNVGGNLPGNLGQGNRGNLGGNVGGNLGRNLGGNVGNNLPGGNLGLGSGNRPNVVNPNQNNANRQRDVTKIGDGLRLNVDPNAGRLGEKVSKIPLGGDNNRPLEGLRNLQPGGPGRGIDLPGNLGRDNNRLDLGRGNRNLVNAKFDKNGLFGDIRKNPLLNDEFNKLKGVRDRDQVDRFFANLKDRPDFKNTQFANLNVDLFAGNFEKNLKVGGFNNLIQTNVGNNLHLGNQYNLFFQGGDVARQLNLHQTLIAGGGWTNRFVGPVYPAYTQAAYSAWYPGPGFYPAYCWTPHWVPWVSWCFWDYCWPPFDPRPIICQPIFYDPCPPIVIYEYPVFQPLPLVVCGTWVDYSPVIVDTGFNLQLVAVRFVDPGHPEQEIGPRFRVWVHNASRAAIGAPFNVTLVAANGPQLDANAIVQAGVSVETIAANETVPVDIRLPFAANRLGLQPDGRRVPFSHLHVIVDSHLALAETTETDNGAILPRAEILPVDPAAFSTDLTAAAPGTLVSLAGEGFGPEPGQVVVSVDGVQLQAEIHGWYDLGVNFKMPSFKLAGAADAQIIVVRGDGAASNPVALTIATEQLLSAAPPPAQ
jgi:hypothetical protein